MVSYLYQFNGMRLDLVKHVYTPKRETLQQMLHISWVSKKFTVSFEDQMEMYGKNWPQHVLLSSLMDACKKETGLQLENMKLLATGGM